jgi:Uma2 family endonuclease
LHAVFCIVWPDESHVWFENEQFSSELNADPHLESLCAIWQAWTSCDVGAGSAEHLLALLQLAPPPPLLELEQPAPMRTSGSPTTKSDAKSLRVFTMVPPKEGRFRAPTSRQRGFPAIDGARFYTVRLGCVQMGECRPTGGRATQVAESSGAIGLSRPPSNSAGPHEAPCKRTEALSRVAARGLLDAAAVPFGATLHPILMASPAQSHTRRFSPGEVLRMVETGILREDEPVELLEGRLVIVTPQGPTHAALVGALADRLLLAYGAGYAVREEKPIELADSLPEPDVVVVRGSQLDYAARHPGPSDVVLAVEVALTSQRLDRDKARIYARGAVAVLWLLDVPARRLEVRADPQPDGSSRSMCVLGVDDEVELPGLTAAWKVRELLP